MPMSLVSRDSSPARCSGEGATAFQIRGGNLPFIRDLGAAKRYSRGVPAKTLSERGSAPARGILGETTMALVTVRVSGPLNRLIYINGDYSQAAGNSSNDSFTVPTGGQIFETLNGAGCIDNRKKFRVSVTDTEVTVALDPVDPPEKV